MPRKTTKPTKSQSKPRRRTKAKEQPEKLLAKVPEEHVFWCVDGRIFRDMRELAEGLAAMSDDIFARHANLEKNDFSNWLRDVIKDENLAEELQNILDRSEAAGAVTTRITILTETSV